MTARKVELTARAPLPAWLVLTNVAAAVLVVGSLVSPVHASNLGARVMLETAITILALASACLLVTRFARTRRLRDLLLLTALTIVALVDFPATVLPAILHIDRAVAGATIQTITEALVACAFLAAAVVPTGKLISGRVRPLFLLSAIGVAAVVLVDVVPALLHAYGAAPATSRAGVGAAVAHPALSVIRLLSVLAMLFAAGAFLRRPEHHDQEPAILAGAAILLAASRVQGLVFPAVAATWITPGALLRFAAYALFLTAALRLNHRTRAEATQALLAAERERIARDLHDGLAQDLAFIASHSDRLADDLGAEHPITVASKRALAVSRGVIIDLAASEEPTTAAALCNVAAEVESRYRVKVAVQVDSGEAEDWDLNAGEREEIVRIAREAILNAVRHGQAERIDVYLGSAQSGLLLRVSDDGCGIDDPQAAVSSGTGLGMGSMRARAALLGGDLVARSTAGGGTQLEVVVS